MIKDHFRFFTNCMVTGGYTRSVIADLQRQHTVFIPNSMAEIIERLNKKETIASLFRDYGSENEATLQEYLDFLEQDGYGFYCDAEEFDRFPDLDFTFRSPCRISNVIIETKRAMLAQLELVVPQIEMLGCKDVALVFYEPLEIADFYFIQKIFKDTIVRSLTLISGYSVLISDALLRKISIDLERLTSLVFYGAPEKREIAWDNEILCDVVFTAGTYRNFSFCGAVHTDYFNTNLPKVLESLNHNSCLHKKIAIDLEGNIRNCPAMPQSFGNIKDISLEEALKHTDFKKYWNLGKDRIEVCKDCEFRHICTDCRAFTELSHTSEEGLDTSRPLKCGYDPYTGQWANWSTNPLKQKAIRHYGMQDVVQKSV